MEIKTLEIEREKVRSELENLRKGIKEGYISKRHKLTRDLMAVYGHLQHGGKIIDVWEAIGDLGLTKNDEPKLAIAQNGAKLCYLYKRDNGSAIFSRENKDWHRVRINVHIGDVALPPDSFNWEKVEEEDRLKCSIPEIPPRISLQISTQILPYHYWILFEPTGWSVSRAPPRSPSDPILLTRLTKNLFGVLATWDLTELEQRIIRSYAK